MIALLVAITLITSGWAIYCIALAIRLIRGEMRARKDEKVIFQQLMGRLGNE